MRKINSEKQKKKSFLDFRQIGEKKKTKIFGVYSSSGGDSLGGVMWQVSWRKYCFFPKDATVFDSNCLQEIIEFLDKINKEHKGKTNESQS